MKRQPPEYKREQDLKTETEVFNYLYKIHHAILPRLFDSYQLVDAYTDRIGSEVYANGEAFWFITFFDDDGDTCHHIYDIDEAVRIGLRRLREKEERDQIIEERRTKICLVGPD